MLQEEEFCGDCLGKSASFEYGYSLFVYNSSLQDSIGRFKYHGRREYASFYAEELYREYGEWISQTGAEALIPVPIHKNRFRTRGYNQAELIARELGTLSGIPVWSRLLVRSRDTLPQKDLNHQERRENLSGAFLLGKQEGELNQIPKCVIIIDDIYTTGSTVEVCSRVLKKAGVHKIYFLCVCIGKGI